MSYAASSTTSNANVAARSHPIAIAPAVKHGVTTFDGTIPQASNEVSDDSLMPYTCVTCARRKVKCDKRKPICSTCSKAKPSLECIYQAPAPRKRKRRPVDDVHDRLDRYESLLRTHGLLPKDEDAPAEPSPTPPRATDSSREATSTATQSQLPPKKGRLVPTAQSGKRYVESMVWRDLSEDELEPSSDEGEDDVDAYRGIHATDPVSASILGPQSSVTDLINSHPTYEAACKLWQVYVDYIDPVCKIVHVPTGREMVQRAAANPSSISKPTEALLFAIYHFAVRVLTEAESTELFGQRRSVLLSTYYNAFQQALVNASFLRSTDFQILQAYTLYLLSVRGSCDPLSFWILTGIAVRMAQRIGLHRNGEALGLEPFDVQMRCRLFWQLLPLDGMASNLCGTGMPGFGEWETPRPLNFEDEDIYPGMTSLPEERRGATSLIFCLVRSYFHQKRSKTWHLFDRIEMSADAIRDALKTIDELESTVEDRFLKAIDPFNPTHCLASAMARGGLTFARMRIRLPKSRDGGNSLPPHERKQLFEWASWFVGYMTAAFRNASLLRFRWHFSTFFQWEPMVWVLSEIRLRSPAVDPDKIWPQIERTYEDHPELLSRRRALHIAVGRLTLKAWDANPPSAGLYATAPAYIDLLRASANKRRHNGRTSDSTVSPLNQFTPDEDTPDPGLIGSSINVNDNIFGMTDSFDTDTVDWQFWDQLIRDPDALLMGTNSMPN